MAPMSDPPGWRILVAAGGTGDTSIRALPWPGVFRPLAPAPTSLFWAARWTGGALGARRRFPFVHGKRTELARPHETGPDPILRSAGHWHAAGFAAVAPLATSFGYRGRRLRHGACPACCGAAASAAGHHGAEPRARPHRARPDTIRPAGVYSLPESSDFLPEPQVVCTGTPIRPEIIAQTSDTAPDDTTRLNILVWRQPGRPSAQSGCYRGVAFTRDTQTASQFRTPNG